MTAIILTLLLAAPAVPVPKPDGQQCPSGYASPAHWCVPMTGWAASASRRGGGNPTCHVFSSLGGKTVSPPFGGGGRRLCAYSSNRSRSQP